MGEMIQRLNEVLLRLEENGLKLKPSKFSLFKRSVPFLGHVVSEAGVMVDSAKIAEVQKWTRPSDVKEFRAFLGFASYYRRFIQDFAKIASPPNTLNKTGNKLEWTSDCETAFEQLKQKLSTTSILSYPVESQTFVLDTDANKEGLGAVLS